jgi:hypothetical protein
MKKLNLRSLIKEEIAKALNEVAAKFQEGDTFIYMGQKHIVLSDNGYAIEAKLPDGKIKKYNYNQIKDKLAENVVLAKTDQGGRSAMRGIESLIKQYPNLPLQDLVDSALTDNNVNSIGDLSVEDVYKLNTKIRSSITSSKPKPTPSQDKTNPYDSPGGRPSKGYMGAKYTGD